MKSFKEFFGVIKEGGNAVSGVGRIHQDNVDATLQDIYSTILPKIGITQKNTALLGSTGKKISGAGLTKAGSSGDVDLAISFDALMKASDAKTRDEVFDYVASKIKSFGYDMKVMKGIGVISIAFPISNTNNEQENAKVQLDLMPVPSIKWAEFAFFSPHEKDSVYGGMYRNEIFAGVVKFKDLKITMKALDKAGLEVNAEWERNFLALDQGILRGIQSKIGKKGLTKNHKTISKEFKLNDPEQVVKMFFGPSFKPSDIMTFEQMWKAVNSPKFNNKKNLQKILEFAADGIVSKGQPLPPEMKKYTTK